MKVFEAVAEGARLLNDAAIANPRLDAERLLALALETDRIGLLAHFQDRVEEPRLSHFFFLVESRAQGKPLQYLTGWQEFFGLNFEVNASVLIPRPETEFVVKEALDRFRSGAPWIVDVGTGSGCIAVSVAVTLSQARLWAIDLSGDALHVARRNAARHQVLERIRFLQGDLLGPLPKSLEGQIDGILSNPPYVADRDLPTLQREVRDWEPRMALAGGSSGLSIYRRLIPEAERFLKPGGYLIVEIGFNMREQILALFGAEWQIKGVREDLNGVPRVVIAFRQ